MFGLISLVCILCFLAGFCWLLIAIIDDINEDFDSLNEMKNNIKGLKMKLNQIIQFHSTAKQ